jgi:hypothetical protein
MAEEGSSQNGRQGRKWQKIGRKKQARPAIPPHRNGASPRAGSSREATQGIAVEVAARPVPPVPRPPPPLGRNGRHDAHENHPAPLLTKGEGFNAAPAASTVSPWRDFRHCGRFGPQRAAGWLRAPRRQDQAQPSPKALDAPPSLGVAWSA